MELSELDPGELYVHSVTRKSRSKLCTGPGFNGKRRQQAVSFVSSRAAYFPCNPPTPQKNPYNTTEYKTSCSAFATESVGFNLLKPTGYVMHQHA